jgi:hypothetical protein
VGITGVKQHHSQQNQQMITNQQTHYEKMRNSYQLPQTKFAQNDLKINIGSNSFHMQKSPKLGNTGIKNLKIGAAPGSHAQPMQYNSVNTQSLG